MAITRHAAVPFALLRNPRKTGTGSSVPPEEIASSSPVWRHAAVPFALLRNPRKTGTGSSVPPEEIASSSPVWRHAAVPFALLVSSLLLAGGQSPMDEGMREYRSGHFKDAVESFKKSVAFNPADVQAHLALANAYTALWLPGLNDAANVDILNLGKAEFQTVLQLDPSNVVALEGLCQLAYNDASAGDKSKLDEAAKWYQTLVSVEPNSGDAHYVIGAIAWSKSYAAIQTARTGLHLLRNPRKTGPESSMPPEALAGSSPVWRHAAVPFALPADFRQPLPDEAVRESLNQEYGLTIAN